jgi:DNA topoisomerase-1
MGFKEFYLEAKEDIKVYSEKELEDRQKKKSGAIKTLQSNIAKLKSKLSSDLNSSDEKTKLTALAITIINITKERVGGENSAKGIRKDLDTGKLKDGGEKHHGITTLKSSHVTISSGSATLKYIGKSGVHQSKVITDKRIVAILKEYKNKNNDFLFVTKEGLKIKATNVNGYLKEFEVTAKSLRSYGANETMIGLLKSKPIPSDEKERKKLFLQLADETADVLGHGRNMLISSYLLPKLKDTYITKGKIISLG